MLSPSLSFALSPRALSPLSQVLRKYKTSNLLIVQLMVPKAMALEVSVAGAGGVLCWSAAARIACCVGDTKRGPIFWIGFII